MKTNFLLILAVAAVVFGSCEQAVEEKESIGTEVVADNELAPGLIHTVYFWMKDSLTSAELKSFEAGLETLATIPSVRKIYTGKPAATDNRGVVDNSFDYALHIWFDDLEGHDAYQVHPTHLKLVEMSGLWDKVVVRDNVGM